MRGSENQKWTYKFAASDKPDIFTVKLTMEGIPASRTHSMTIGFSDAMNRYFQDANGRSCLNFAPDYLWINPSGLMVGTQKNSNTVLGKVK